MDYVLGFAFSLDNRDVVLIRKSKPIQQVGKLNGVGGKLEYQEIPVEGMIREFQEECGLQTTPNDWTNFANLVGSWGTIYIFSANLCIKHACTQEEEVIEIHKVDSIHMLNTMNNLPWLIKMAQSMKGESCNRFSIIEEE